MADVDATPEELIPEKLSDGSNIDLSISVLRGTSRMHIKYLKNMGVKASLSVSLMKQNKLWGLMAFHHNTPKLPPNSLIPELLAACELLGDVVSVILYPKLEINNLSSQTKKIQTIDKCFNKINLLVNNDNQLEQVFDNLFSDFKQDVIGFSLEKNIYIKSEGNRVQPKKQFAKKISSLFSEKNLNLYKNTVVDSRKSPFLTTKPAKVCGILAIKSTKLEGLVIFFGRFELERDINWGGKPGTVDIVVKNGVREFEPRSSFALWKQKTHGISKDWNEYDIELIQKLTSYTENYILYQVNEEVKSKLYINSYTDFLTNIPNRRYIEEYFQKKINCKSVSVLFIDLDDFKKVNDYFGHQYGDILLRQDVDKIKACTDENAIIARLGGDEFFVVLHYDVDIKNSIKNSVAVSNSIRESIKKPISIGKSNVYIDLSIGIFTFDPKKVNYQDVFKCSDIAMYKAKENGKSSIHVFDDNDEKKMFYELHVEAKIRDSILTNSDELDFVLQPQYDSDNNIVGAEALARWSNSELGNVNPETFIKIAEKSQIIEQLGKHIYSNVCKKTTDILNSSYSNFNQKISINISSKQLFSSNFIEWLLETNIKYKIPFNKICLEITESIFIDNFDLASNIINKLRTYGYLISLDDFGTGFASLSYLIKIPVDELKIDQIFVQNIDKNSESLAMIEGVMALCKKMNFKTVAEGVENKQQYQILKNLGCDVFQGYYLGRPVKLNEFKKLLKK